MQVAGLDEELAELRQRVDCRTVLEQAGWDLDARESSRRAAKYRQGAGRIVIVTHEGKGWFDPLSDGRGDVLALARHVWGLNLGHARKVLRPLAGLPPRLAPTRGAQPGPSMLDARAEWRKAPLLRPGTPGWRYLTEVRALPCPILHQAILHQAILAGSLREGIRGTVWAMHQAADASVTGWEMRGPSYKGYCKGGSKSLFWVGRPALADRVAVTESFLDALSLAALEDWPPGTVYASTGGGWGPATADALQALLTPSVRIVVATDHDVGGEALAGRLHRLTAESGVSSERLRPEAKDWNDQLVGRASRAGAA